MKPTRNLYGIHNDFCGVGGGLRRGCILIRNRDGGGGGGGVKSGTDVLQTRRDSQCVFLLTQSLVN